MGQNDIIELNGKQYDAYTGVLLAESLVKATPASRAKATILHQGRSVDGFIKGKQKQHTSQAPKPASSSHHVLKRQAPKKLSAHQPQKATTLMRHIVRKPVIERKPQITVSAPTKLQHRTVSDITRPLEHKLSADNIDPIRLAHARHIARSHHIHRFVTPKQTANEPLAVQPAVAPMSSPQAVTAAALPQSKPDVKQIFETALAQAVSHEQPKQQSSGKRASRHRRFVNIAAVIACFLVIGSFIAYLNMPAVELQMASMHAGFQVAAPGYKPTGYSLANGIQASKGNASMTYRSGDSSYTVTQTASNWDSTTLLDQNIEKQGAPIKTMESQGRIVYIYKHSATWVNGGILYTVVGNAPLSANDMVSLATSM